LYEELINKGNQAGLDELIAANFVDHNPFPGQAPGLESVKPVFTMMTTAFPDMHMTVEDQTTEGDKVASRLTILGTHKGAFQGIPATGKQATVTGIDIFRIAGGKGMLR